MFGMLSRPASRLQGLGFKALYINPKTIVHCGCRHVRAGPALCHYNSLLVCRTSQRVTEDCVYLAGRKDIHDL